MALNAFRSDGQVMPSSAAAAFMLPTSSVGAEARSVSARSARKRLGCQPRRRQVGQAVEPHNVCGHWHEYLVAGGQSDRYQNAELGRAVDQDEVAWPGSLECSLEHQIDARLTGEITVCPAEGA
jgi:hypothetical protein